MDAPQIITALLAALGTGGAVTQVVALLRERHKGAPLDETQARLDIVAQRDTAVTGRTAAEHERDEANARAAREGQRADAAEAREDRLDRHISELREFCLAHGTPLTSLPARPSL